MEPFLDVDPDLPIAAAVPDIAAALLSSQVVVVAGETGSGKTTQLPKICLLAGRRSIGHTQPRRIAARTLAERIAEETRTELGELVGYQVRFTRKAGRGTRVKVMTDGILLAEIAHDRDLRAYDTIIVDEAHERSLNIDFLLGYLKQLLPRRPDLKVIVTSATIDTARFSEHFDDAPVVEVSGRTYPVEMRYRPVRDDGAVPDEEEAPRSRPAPPADERDLTEAICDAVVELQAAGEGDVLVFCSGEREIRDASDAITARNLRFTEVLPLYARLSVAEQHRVFAPHTGRRVVIATNVAETSLTVPGIRYVVDSGTARISRYSKRTKVQRLPIEPISRASADQRAGRCGRVAPGICIRLYSEADYETRPQYTEPEILRTNLASVILQMAEAELGDIVDFPFVEPPDAGQITDGLRTLTELGALEGRGTSPRLTPVGHQLARLPVDPRLARMLVEASARGCLREVQVIVAALAIPDVKERPQEKREQADQLHRRFWAPAPGVEGEQAAPDGSDFVAILRLWAYLRDRRKVLSGNAFRRLCRDEYLNALRVREWQDLHTQLRQICDELDLARNTEAAPADLIHTAILSGLLSHVGLLDTRNDRTDLPARKRARLGPREYRGARGAAWAIAPGSAIARTPPPLAVAYELVETSRLWGRTVAGVEAEWIEAVAGHVLSRSYAEPHWSESQGAVLAYETVNLYGIPIIAGRTVQYSRIDPEEARRIFIQAALVEGRWRTRHHFAARNASVREQAAELEERTRRRDLVVDDAAIFGFYDARVPPDVVSQRHFDSWWRTKRREDDAYLDLTLEDLVADEQTDVSASGFPDWWHVGSHELEITYVFDPGSQHDGASIEIPVTILNQLPPAAFTWNVPGYREELATELIRSLPKHVRTAFVPAPNHAAAALAWLAQRPDVASAPAGDTAPDNITFPDALAVALRTLTGTDPSGLWGDRELPPHLRATLVVVDGGKEVARGEDLAALQTRLTTTVSRTLTRVNRRASVTGATTWSFPPLEERLVTMSGSTEVVGYPALRDEGSTVGVAVLDTEQRAGAIHARGLRRLVQLTSPDPTTWVVSRMSNATKLQLGASPYPTVPALLADARLRAIDTSLAALGVDPWGVRDADRFAEIQVAVRERQADTMRGVVAYVGEVLARHREVMRELSAAPSSYVTEDVREQVANLVHAGFVLTTPDPWFDRLSRYLHAAEMRLVSYRLNPGRERQSADVIAELEDEYAELVSGCPEGPLPVAVANVGWLLEELRVSLFAQQLRTAEPVSAKRVRSAMASCRR
jgi:ATP-dependent helicase HrpA